MSTHVPEHAVSEPLQVQAPDTHVPPPHEKPHVPQFFASVLVSTHVPAHKLGLVVGHAHVPLTQT